MKEVITFSATGENKPSPSVNSSCIDHRYMSCSYTPDGILPSRLKWTVSFTKKGH